MTVAASHQFMVSALSSRISRLRSFLSSSKGRWVSTSAALLSISASSAVGNVFGVTFFWTAGGVESCVDGVVWSATPIAANASTTTIVQYHTLERSPLSENSKPTTTALAQNAGHLTANRPPYLSASCSLVSGPKAVLPSAFLALGSAPASKRVMTTSGFSFQNADAAKCSTVSPSLVRASTLAPCFEQDSYNRWGLIPRCTVQRSLTARSPCFQPLTLLRAM